MRSNKPWYLAAMTVRGFEDPPVVEPPVVEPPVVEPKVGEPNPDTGKVYTEDEVAGLKSALDKERKTAKENAKKLAAFEKAQKDKEDAEKSEIQRLTDQGISASEKLQKLSAGFRKSKVESAVVAAARKALFTDPTDALRPEVLEAIGVEQDEDDPTQVTIDSKTVEEAITKLAKAKPHWLTEVEDPNKKKPRSPSGSKFGGSNNTQTPSAEDKLAEMFPALRMRG